MGLVTFIVDEYDTFDMDDWHTLVAQFIAEDESEAPEYNWCDDDGDLQSWDFGVW